jgi:signal transduction histidine kinase
MRLSLRAIAVYILLFFVLILTSKNLFSQSKNKIDSLNNLPFEQKINNPKLQLYQYLNASRSAKSIGYLKGEIESYENVSLIYYYLGRYDLELEYALAAIRGFMKLENKEKVARLYGELGYRMKKTDLAKAEFYMQKGMSLAEKEALIKPLMGIYDNYGVIKEMQVQYDSAFFYYSRALRLKRQYEDISGLPYSLNNLGGLMLLEKKYDDALPFFTEALDIRRQIGDTIGMCETHFYLADLNRAQESYKYAIENLNFVIDHATRHGMKNLLSEGLKKRSALHELSGDLFNALEDERLSRVYADSLSQQSFRDKVAELQVNFETQEKEKELLSERLKSTVFKNWIWVLGLLSLVILLSAFSIQIKRTSEKRRLELQNLKDLEFERMRISRDLHDNIGAELTLITSKLDIKAATTKRAEEQVELNELASLSREASVLLRETIWSIRQDAIQKSDLLEKISQFAQKRSEGKLEMRCELGSDPNEEINSSNALHLYRIAQEAINNTVKYSKATRIHIKFSNHSFTIADNGIGFDHSDYTPGYGIYNMKQRSEEMGAEFILISTEKGTTVGVEKLV